MSITQPRSWLKAPELFGSAPGVEWRDDREALSLEGRVGIEAARIQHEIAYFVRRERRAHGWTTWAAVAEHTPIEVGAFQMRALMRGETAMSLRHIAALAVTFGPLVSAGMTDRQQRDDSRRLRRVLAARNEL